MPYVLRRLPDGAYQVRNAVSGRLHSRHTTRAKAQAQLRLLHMVDARKAAAPRKKK